MKNAQNIFLLLTLNLAMVLGSMGQASDLETRGSRNVILQNLLNGKGLQNIPNYTLVKRTQIAPQTESVELNVANAGVPSFRVFLKKPTSGVIKRVVLIIPGMATQIENLVGIAPVLEDTLLAAFDFYIPWTIGVAQFVQRVQEIPFQITLSLGWLHTTYAVPISVVSVSLGTFFHPMAVGMFQRWRQHVDSHVLAFGGADFVEIARSLGQPKETLDSIQQNAALLQILDPRFFLPVLKGKSLFLEAESDEIFGRASRDAYFTNIPGERTRVQLPGGHLNQNQPLAIFAALQQIFKFLGVNPEGFPRP